MLRFSCVACWFVLAVGCGPTEASVPNGASPDGGVADATPTPTSPDGAAPVNVSPGRLDPQFGQDGSIRWSGLLTSFGTVGSNVAVHEGGPTLKLYDNAGASSGTRTIPNARFNVTMATSGDETLWMYRDSDQRPPVLRIGRTSLSSNGSGSGDLNVAANVSSGATAIAASGDKILLACARNDQVKLVRLLASGAEDVTFVGALSAHTRAIRPTEDMRVSGDGAVYVLADVGFTPALIRYLPDGTLDSNFGAGGVLELVQLGPRNARALQINASGDAFVLGMTNGSVQVAKVRRDGTLDASFGKGGVARADDVGTAAGRPVEARGLQLQADGKLVVAAETGEGRSINDDKVSLRVLRFKSDGSLDLDFGSGGMTEFLRVPEAGVSRLVGMAILSNRLLVGSQGMVEPTGVIQFRSGVLGIKL